MDLLFVWLYDFYFLIKLLTLPLVERGSCLLLWPERCEDFGKTWKKSFPRNFPANCAVPNYVPRIDTHEMENLCSIFCRTFCLRCLNFRWLWSIFGWPNRLRTTARDDLGLLWFALRLNGGPLDAAIYTAYVTAAWSTIALPLSRIPEYSSWDRASISRAIFTLPPIGVLSHRVWSSLSFLCLRSSGHTERKDKYYSMASYQNATRTFLHFSWYISFNCF